MKINPLKFAIGLVFVSLFRLVHMPLPNIEPIMASMLPFAKKYGKIAGFIFASIALISFDFISGRVGMWTIYTAFTYGIIGFLAGKYFADSSKGNLKHYLGFGIAGTIFYDAVTALLFGWQFGQPLMLTIIGQIPFTIYHLIGNVLMISILTPVMDKAIVENPLLEFSPMQQPTGMVRKCK